MSNFSKILIAEIGATITGKTPSSENLDDFGDDYMFVTPSDNLDNKFIFETNRYLSEIGMQKLKNKLLPPKSLLVSCIGSAMGKVTINKSLCITNQQINSIVVNEKYDADYLYYRLKNSYEMLRNAALGSTALPMLNKTDFDNLEISIHKNKTTQQKIAAVLSSLDSKIELNNKINAELEAMAKTLYDYWFVHNDKVCKWEIVKLGDFITVNERSVTKDYSHNEIEYIDIASVSVGRLESTQKYELTNAPSRARRLVKHGDTIWSTVRPNRKSYLFISNPKENLVVSTGFAVLTPKTIPPSFLYFLSITDKFVNFLISNAEGSAYPAVSADKFTEIEFPMPPEKELTEFEKNVSPMLVKITQNQLENQTLSELRDWLLPMLMNGQVTVS